MTRQELANRLHRDLGALAVDAGWSTTASDGQPDGSYTDPIDDALLAAGVDDVTLVASADLVPIRQAALAGCLERLERHYATLVDTTTGPLSQKLSQTREAIKVLRESLPLGVVTLGRLTRSDVQAC